MHSPLCPFNFIKGDQEKNMRKERGEKEEGQWSRVHGRKRKQQKWDISQQRLNKDIKGYGGEVRTVSTFFVTEFPEECMAKDLYNRFEEFGEVDEVIIPPKIDIRGKRFGFVRFFNMENASFLATKLDNIFIGSRKLHVNVPKHERSGNRVVVECRLEVTITRGRNVRGEVERSEGLDVRRNMSHVHQQPMRKADGGVKGVIHDRRKSYA